MPNTPVQHRRLVSPKSRPVLERIDQNPSREGMKQLLDAADETALAVRLVDADELDIEQQRLVDEPLLVLQHKVEGPHAVKGAGPRANPAQGGRAWST
jgi:hypothetical protein